MSSLSPPLEFSPEPGDAQATQNGEENASTPGTKLDWGTESANTPGSHGDSEETESAGERTPMAAGQDAPQTPSVVLKDDDGFIMEVRKRKKGDGSVQDEQEESPLSKKQRDVEGGSAHMLSDAQTPPASQGIPAAPVQFTLALNPYWRGVYDGTRKRPGLNLDASVPVEEQIKYWRGVAQGAMTLDDPRSAFNTCTAAENEEASPPEAEEPAILVPGTPSVTADSDMDEDAFTDPEIRAPSKILPPVNKVPEGRLPAHVNPPLGELIAHALPYLRRPVGPTRRSVMVDYPDEQRQALLDYDDYACLAYPEQDDDFPIDDDFLEVVLGHFCRTYFEGQEPMHVTTAHEKEDGTRSRTAFITGTELQIAHLVAMGGFSTNKLCFFIVPNVDKFPDFIATFKGPQLPYEAHPAVANLFGLRIANAPKVQEFAAENGIDLAQVTQHVDLQYVLTKDRRGYDRPLWNLSLPCPVRSYEALAAWRKVVAAVRPSDNIIGQFIAIDKPFFCKTCRCLTHPQGMCGTIEEEMWFGFIPRARGGAAPAPSAPEQTPQLVIPVEKEEHVTKKNGNAPARKPAYRGRGGTPNTPYSKKNRV